MGRNAGRHTYSDTVRAVQQQVGDLDWKHRRLFFRLVKVWYKVHNILIQVCQVDFLGYLFQAGFRVPHGSCPIPLYRTKVSVSVHQRLAFFKFLRHDHKGFIDGAVAVGVVFTHSVTYNTGTFPVRPVIADSQFVHIVKGPPLYRL